jgi:hypothetical protein
LAANLVLAAAFVFTSRSRPVASPAPLDPQTSTQFLQVTGAVRTNVVVRRQFFSWAELESSDYPTYIANLRRIGCPEATIRDIIVADVNDLYARKIAAEVVTSDQQWWRSNPDPEVERAAVEKLQQLDTERRTLLTSLLGPDWDRSLTNLLVKASTDAPPPGIVLTGPILGALPEETKQAIQGISARATRRVQDYLDRMQAAGKQPDPAELARIRQQTRDELANLLTPTQLEEYLLRYSQNSTQLREQFRGFAMQPEEFRNVFRALDPFEQKLALLNSAADPASLQQRAELEQQREKALRDALGPARYQAYQITIDPAFQQARNAAQLAGASPEAAMGLYQINKAVEEERARISIDPTLSTADRIEQLQRAATEQEKALLSLFGEDGYQRYRRSTNAPASR